MDKFKTLEPVRLYSNTAANHPTSSSKPRPLVIPTHLVGRLPSDLHQLILQHLPIPDFPAYARCSHATAALADSEKIWEAKCRVLQIVTATVPILDQLESIAKSQNAVTKAALPPTLPVDDEFGDFSATTNGIPPSVSQDEMGDFVGGDIGLGSPSLLGSPSTHPSLSSSSFDNGSLRSPSSTSSGVPSLSFRTSFQPKPSGRTSLSSDGGLGFGFMAAYSQRPTQQAPVQPKETFKSKYIRAHKLLMPLLKSLSSPPHLIHNDLTAHLMPPLPTKSLASAPPSSLTATSTNANANTPSLRTQAKLLKLLFLFLSSPIQPIRDWQTLSTNLRGAMDRFDASLLAAFDVADGKGDEKGMKEAAESSWEIWVDASASTGGRGRGVTALGGSGGDWEMGKVWAEKREVFYEQSKWKPLDNFTKDGTLSFDAMDEFMNEILEALDEHGSRAVRVFPPASQVLISFAERLANEVVGEYITQVLIRAREISTSVFLRATAASFGEAWRMVEGIMKAAKAREGQREGKKEGDDRHGESERDAEGQGGMTTLTRAEDVVYQMFEMNMDEYLDEEIESLKLAFQATCKAWDQSQSSSSTSRFLSSQNPALVKRNVLASFTSVLLLPVTIVPRTVGAVGGAIMNMGGNTQGIAMLNPQRWVSGGGGGGGMGSSGASANASARGYGEVGESGGKLEDDDDDPEEDITIYPSKEDDTSKDQDRQKDEEKLELLLSLDVALELIHADREGLKRVETFSGYPGHYGYRVRDTIEEVFILMLQSVGEGHVEKGFIRATQKMTEYKPAENEVKQTGIIPLLQFFELVHIGDTIQSMVQVYFEKELAPHIDKTDFLNAVVREKKRFENVLDDRVASGLNAGTELLMNQVEHIIQTMTQPREYYPPEDAPLDLGPTKGCSEAIKCLETHCKLLKGSTSREVLEVFYQEVGIRLIAILQKHIKRQIISLNGGFQVIADLNTYHAFITSLKVPSIAADFSHLKMLGHVYVVEDAKELAQIVRDVTRYGGAYRPEDIYEFIQRRSDWKKIEKVVDKTMYNLNIKEDCVIA